MPFATDEVEKVIVKWREDGYCACHHSDKFRSNYLPAYRVIKKEYAIFLPLLLKIDNIFIEGAYSMHPKLTEYYNLSVFLDISSQLQEK